MADENMPQKRQIVTRAEALERGLKHYFTGKPCKRGHISDRLASGKCIVCSQEYNKTWFAANPDKVRAYGRAKHARDPVKARKRAADWYKANTARANAAAKAYRAADPQGARVRRKAWIAANKSYYDECKRASVRRRRAKAKGAEGNHTAKQVIALASKQRKKCATCKRSIRDGFHVDHIVPIARGGSNAISNIQLLCAPCNLRKNAKDPIAWARENGRLL